MKRLLFVLLLLASGLRAAGQNTSISSSMVDTDGIAWANGTWRIDFRPNSNNPNESTYRLLNGQPLSATVTHQNGVLDGTGHFSITIYDSTLIVPTGSGWTLTLCPLASAPCGTYQFSSAGGSMDISSNLTSSIAAPRFPPSAGAFGYADVEVQTSLNQGATYWNVISGTMRVWNGAAWVSSGGASFPGVSPDGQTPPGINVAGNVNSNSISSGAVTASSLPGYRQNTVNARSRNRDEVLQLTITPQDMPGCEFSGRGLIDDAPCFAAAIQYLATTDDHVLKRLLVPYSLYGYTFRTPQYLQQLPHDFGDYHGWASSTAPVSVAPYVSGGVIQSCTASGGSGYAPNAQLPVFVTDSILKGSGGFLQVSTDSTGTPNGCTVVQGGMNYNNSSIGTVTYPIGGDGATATCNLATNTFTGCTVSTGGSGYYGGTISGQTMQVNAPGLVCTSYPTFSATVTGTAVTAVSATAGAGCTYQGGQGGCTSAAPCASYGTVPVYFGNSCGGGQCHLLTPEPVVNMACAVALISGLTIEGIGNPVIFGGWDNGLTNPNQNPNEMITFCDPTGQNSNMITIKNLTIESSMISFYFPYMVNQLTIDTVNFGRNTGMPVYAYGISNQGSPPYHVPWYQTYFNDPPYNYSIFRNINFWGYGGITCGGSWMGRSQQANNVVNPGGLQNIYGALIAGNVPYHQTENTSFVPCSNIRVDNIVFNSSLGQNSTSNAVDSFFEQYIWKTQNGPANSAFPVATSLGNMSNGLGFVSNGGPGCKYTQTVVDRTVDFQFGYPNTPPGNNGYYPYAQCFPGYTMSVFVAHPRYSSSSGGSVRMSFSDIQVLNAYQNRPIITGNFNTLRVDRIGATMHAAFTDPYLQTGEVRGGINVTTRAAGATSRIEDFNTSYTTPFQTLYFGSSAGLANQYFRNVSGINDNIPYYGNLGTTMPTITNPGMIVLNDINGAAGGANIGGAIGFGSSYAGTFVGLKGSQRVNTLYGDIVFESKYPSSSWGEKMRMNYNGMMSASGPDYSYGTQSISGCGGVTTPLGGAWAGSFHSNAATCTLTITSTWGANVNGVGGFNGYRCEATDLTNPANILSQTSYTNTTCVISGPTTIGDLITWQVTAAF